MQTHALETIALSLIAAAVAACGGKARAPRSPDASHLALVHDGTTEEVYGLAFAQRLPALNHLSVLAFDADTEPNPSCEMLAALLTQPQAQKMTRGGFISVGVENFKGAAGNYAASEAMALLYDPDQGNLTMIGKPVEGTSLILRSYDDRSFSAEVTSTGAGPRVTGSVRGTVCPPLPGTLGSDAAEQATAPDLAAEPEPPAEKPRSVVRRVDAEGLLGVKLGEAPRKFPKAFSKQPQKEGVPAGTVLYSAKRISYLGIPLKGADVLVVDGVVVQVAAGATRCKEVLAKMKKRYGAGEDYGDVHVWSGERSTLRLAPHIDGMCLIQLSRPASL